MNATAFPLPEDSDMPDLNSFYVCHDGARRSIAELMEILEDLFNCGFQWVAPERDLAGAA